MERQRPVWPGVSDSWSEGDLVFWTQVHSEGHLRLAEAREAGERGAECEIKAFKFAQIQQKGTLNAGVKQF